MHTECNHCGYELRMTCSEKEKYNCTLYKDSLKNKKDILSTDFTNSILKNEKKSIIYISGKIAGLDPYTAKQNFLSAQTTLEFNNKGCTIINPYDLHVISNLLVTWEEYMLQDIKFLFRCNTIFMLSNWEDSKGARIERAIAIEMEMKVLYQNYEHYEKYNLNGRV